MGLLVVDYIPREQGTDLSQRERVRVRADHNTPPSP
jgi:hypothetical protein